MVLVGLSDCSLTLQHLCTDRRRNRAIETKTRSLQRLLQMSSIHRLDQKVLKLLRSQVSTVSIASAVTELVQNSIDAAATKVDVVIDISKASFMVCDDGSGMVPADLDQLGLHNVTSKIEGLGDLKALKTYGFRGEAVFCLASVCHMKIASKVEDYSSGRIRTLPHSSRTFNEKVVGSDSILTLVPFASHEHGTRIIVEDLLYNTPVRRKIIENEPAYKTFMALKENLFQLLVIHPELQVNVSYVNESGLTGTLFSSSNISSQLTAHQKLSLAFLNTFGSIVPQDSLRRVSVVFKEVKLNGIISRNAVRVKDFQLIYINGRKYHNASLLRTIDNLFQTTIFANSVSNKTDVKFVGKPYANHAVIVLDIRSPQSIDDVLQDRSEKLLLAKHSEVLHPLILKIVRSFLSHQGFFSSNTDEPDYNLISTIPSISSQRLDAVLNSRIRMAKIDGREINGRLGKGRLSVEGLKKQKLNNLPKQIDVGELQKPPTVCFAQSYPSIELRASDRSDDQYHFKSNYDFSIRRSHLLNAEVVNQFGKKFVLLKLWPSRESSRPILVIADQHACDERIKLETYLGGFIDDVLAGTIQPQMIGDCTLEIPAADVVLFEHFKEEFLAWGISYRLSARNQGPILTILSLPAVLKQKYNGDREYLKAILQQMVHDMKSLKKLSISSLRRYGDGEWSKQSELSRVFGCIPEVFREIFNSKACRSAIMFGDSLSKSECTFLIKKLAECWLPFQCAHGRPSMIPLAEVGTLEANLRFTNISRKTFSLDYDAKC